jgi:hypothetical protein
MIPEKVGWALQLLAEPERMSATITCMDCREPRVVQLLRRPAPELPFMALSADEASAEQKAQTRMVAAGRGLDRPVRRGLHGVVTGSRSAALVIRPLTADLWPAFVDLLDQGSPAGRCWCMAPLIGADYRRCPPQRNRADFVEVARRSPERPIMRLSF